MIIEVEIKNWDKYNPKRDQTTYSWLRLDNEFYCSPDLFDLTCEQKMVWIAILCIASRKNSGKVQANLNYIAHHLRIDVDSVREAIEIFEDRGLTTAHDRARPQTTPTKRTNERTNVTNETFPAPLVAVAVPKNPLPGKIWEAYTNAYFLRYGTEPVRNAKVNTQIAQLAKRLGEEAPEVVRFYVGHSKSWYVQKAHEIGLCLADAEGLRTQWATGTKITTKLAQQVDTASALGDQIKRIREGKL